MKEIACIIFLGLLFAMTGCIASVHPLYTKRDLIFDPALLGTWYYHDSKKSCTYTKDGDKRYKLVCEGGDNKNGKFIVHLLKLVDHRFLDIYPLKPDLKEVDLSKRYHTFVRVKLHDDSLQIALMSPDWLQRILKENPDAVSHMNLDDKSVLLTAPTKELQTFVIKYVKTKEAWIEGESLTRQPEKSKQ